MLLAQSITVQADLLIPDAISQIDTFDILLVPGGMPKLILSLCKARSPELQLVEAFNNSPSPSSSDEKIIFSVCTGALFLGAAGVLAGLTATTHHMALDLLSELEKEVKVVSSVTDGEGEGDKKKKSPTRYVDGGVNRQGKRVVTAGGVTCGMDAALHVAEIKAGRQAAEFVAQVAEHEWKRVEGV